MRGRILLEGFLKENNIVKKMQSLKMLAASGSGARTVQKHESGDGAVGAKAEVHCAR